MKIYKHSVKFTIASNNKETEKLLPTVNDIKKARIIKKDGAVYFILDQPFS